MRVQPTWLKLRFRPDQEFPTHIMHLCLFPNTPVPRLLPTPRPEPPRPPLLAPLRPPLLAPLRPPLRPRPRPPLRPRPPPRPLQPWALRCHQAAQQHYAFFLLSFFSV